MSPSTLLLAFAALAAGLVAGWLIGRAQRRGAVERVRLTGAERLTAAETRVEAEVGRRADLQAELHEVRAGKEAAEKELAALGERTEHAEAALREQREFLESSREDLENSFRALAAAALQGNNEEFLRLAEERWSTTREQAARDLEERRQGIETLLAPLKDTLVKLETRTGEIERAREGAYQALLEQLRGLQEATASLHDKTTSLDSVLRGSQAQGRWGELALKNVVELAGMSQHVDFQEQATVRDGRRPDLVVRLPGNRRLAVDAKVPFNAYVEAAEAKTQSRRDAALDRHVAALREHVKKLAARDYAEALGGTVDLVVLFLPGDAFLSAAFARDPDLQLNALRQKVLIATPTTLVALLRTVAIYWQQESMAKNAEKIAGVARDLYERAAIFGEHLSRVGDGLDSAVDAFNRAAGSFERRLLPMGRRLEELKIAEQVGRTLEAPPTIEDAPKALPNRTGELFEED